MQADAPVVVGRVVKPAGHGMHVLGEVAWTVGEYFPATQLGHFFHSAVVVSTGHTSSAGGVAGGA